MTLYPGTFNSSALQVKSALVAALQAETGAGGQLPGVQVTYGWPGRDPEREWIFFGNISWSEEDWAPYGARHREENYTIDLIINIQRPGGQDSEVETTAFAYLGVVEAYLRNNPFQPSTGQITQLDLVPEQTQTSPLPDGCECELRAKVRVMARI